MTDAAIPHRRYRLWPLAFSPSPGPARLNADRTPSLITSVIVDYVEADGSEHEVGRFAIEGAPSVEAQNAMLRQARQKSAAHYLANRPDGPWVIASVPPSILEDLPERPMTPAEIREMSRDNS